MAITGIHFVICIWFLEKQLLLIPSLRPTVKNPSGSMQSGVFRIIYEKMFMAYMSIMKIEKS